MLNCLPAFEADRSHSPSKASGLLRPCGLKWAHGGPPQAPGGEAPALEVLRRQIGGTDSQGGREP